jgi:hypothetical protein
MEMLGIEIDINDKLNQARKMFINKEYILISHQRLGKVTDVMCDHDGFLLLLLYIYKHNTKDFLNSKPWTRQYRRLSELRNKE